MKEVTSKCLKEMPHRNPTSGTFELTIRCNLHCKMCLFRHDDKENSSIIKKELTAQQWIQMAEEAVDMGTVQLLITGGEPLIRPDFCEIWEGIYIKGFWITLYTNATLVTPQIMETLRKYPPHKIGITMYGATAETYEKVCGNAEAFGRAIEGVHRLQELPSKLEFRTTIIKDNYYEAKDIEKLVHEEFGEEYCLTQARMVTKAVRGGCADVESCRVSPEENVQLAFGRGIEDIKKRVGDSYDEKYLRFEYVDRTKKNVYEPKLTLFGCDAGMNSYTISWNGKLLGCQMLGVFQTDTITLGLRKAWDEFPKVIELPSLDNKCRECKNLKICNCCYASRYAETGDLGGCPEYVCKDTTIISRLLNKGGKYNE